jgi:hypothetical protein
MNCALQARQFSHEWHSALGAAMLRIWWNMEGIAHYEVEKNLTFTAERYCQQLGRLEKAIQQKRPGRRHWVIFNHDNVRRDESGHPGTRLGDSSTSTVLFGPCPIGLLPLMLSLQKSAPSFLQQRR